MIFSGLSFGLSTVTNGVCGAVIASVHVYLPVSEVVRRENVRATPVMFLSPEVATVEPFTIHVTTVSILMSSEEKM